MQLGDWAHQNVFWEQWIIIYLSKKLRKQELRYEENLVIYLETKEFYSNRWWGMRINVRDKIIK